MKTVEISLATASLAASARCLKREPLLLTKEGRPYAALVAIADATAETIALSTNRQFLDIIQRSRARHKAEGGVSAVELRRRLGVRGVARRR
jgi:antitoxin (DNA-binding transcriptional repressor) of toxin-antitoxin stability system